MDDQAQIKDSGTGGTALRHAEARYRAQQRVQQRIWQMHGPGDIDQVWQAIVDGLRELEIPFDNCNINIVREPGSAEATDGEGPTDAGLGMIEQFWRAGETVYRRNLEEKDVYGERAGIEGHFRHTVLAVIDVPFSHGTLGLNSSRIDPFTPWHIEILEEFAQVLSAGFRRMEDLILLEERNRELEEEITDRKQREKRQMARYRVREQVWRMRHTEDIAGVLEAVRDNFQVLEIPYTYCSINLVKEEAKDPQIVVYVHKEQGDWRRHVFPFSEDLPFLEIWRRGQPAYRPDLERDDPFGERSGFKVPIRAVVDIPFAQGTLAMSSLEPDAFSPRDLEVLQDMARMLSEGFRRLDDLEVLEVHNRKLEREVAERRQAEKELYQAKEAAEAANRAKSAFLANMSHELRTPLNAILGFTQLLQRDPTLDTEPLDNLAIIGRNGEHLLGLINDILEVSRIEAGRTELQEEAFDLRGLSGDLEELFRLRARERGLRLLCEYSETVPRYVCADESKLRQVLINLLSNALKFTEEGGVTLRLEYDEERLYCQVTDTGIGIAPEDVETLFDAFVQTARGASVQGGTGLGLAICQQFVRTMGGQIAVRSKEGVGSTFSFDIPVAPASEGEVVERLPRRRIVGLEPDQPHYRLLLSRLLLPLGFEVRERLF